MGSSWRCAWTRWSPPSTRSAEVRPGDLAGGGDSAAEPVLTRLSAGAGRIELCAGLVEGGTTPSMGEPPPPLGSLPLCSPFPPLPLSRSAPSAAGPVLPAPGPELPRRELSRPCPAGRAAAGGEAVRAGPGVRHDPAPRRGFPLLGPGGGGDESRHPPGQAARR